MVVAQNQLDIWPLNHGSRYHDLHAVVIKHLHQEQRCLRKYPHNIHRKSQEWPTSSDFESISAFQMKKPCDLSRRKSDPHPESITVKLRSIPAHIGGDDLTEPEGQRWYLHAIQLEAVQVSAAFDIL